MISILRRRTLRIVALPVAALILVMTLGIRPASAAPSSQVCGNSGTGYCLNDWGGAGATNDPIKMYTGSTTNDYFYVQAVNRCNARDLVTSTNHGDSNNCPFGNAALDDLYWHKTIMQIVYGNNPSQCVGSTSSFKAVLAPCANALVGSGGGNGVIMVAVGSSGATFFADRYAFDLHYPNGQLTSGGNPGLQAFFGGGSGTPWGGFAFLNP